MLSASDKLNITIRGPMGAVLLRPDSEVIERPDWYQITTPSCAHTFLNEVSYSKISPGDADRVIQEVIEHYRRLKVPFKWCVGPWTEPPEFGEKLSALGFAHWDVRGMIAPSRVWPIEIPASIKVEPVTAENLTEFVWTYLKGWEFSESERKLTHQSIADAIADGRQRRHFFLARINGTPAGTASFFRKREAAYLMGGNILPEFRKQGLYSALVAQRLEAVRYIGLNYAVTHARAHTSAPILERLGFETMFESRVYQSPAW